MGSNFRLNAFYLLTSARTRQNVTTLSEECWEEDYQKPTTNDGL